MMYLILISYYELPVQINRINPFPFIYTLPPSRESVTTPPGGGEGGSLPLGKDGLGLPKGYRFRLHQSFHLHRCYRHQRCFHPHHSE